MIDMLKRHEIQVLRRAGHSQIEVATLAGVARRTVQRVDGEAAVTHIDSVREHEVRGIWPSGEGGAVSVGHCRSPGRRAAVAVGRSAPTGQAQRLRGWQDGALRVDPRAATEDDASVGPLEGLAGEFTQHDFGHVDVRFLNDTEKQVHFFASRLKYSRWVEVTIVPDERTETLVRTFVDHFAAIGGVPLLAVFDRPKTVALKWTRDGQVTDWNPLFAGVALDLSVGIEVCWPAAPWQKVYASHCTS